MSENAAHKAQCPAIVHSHKSNNVFITQFQRFVAPVYFEYIRMINTQDLASEGCSTLNNHSISL